MIERKAEIVSVANNGTGNNYRE